MYIAGFNQPGYLPEETPEEFDNFEDALAYLLDTLAGEIDNDDEYNRAVDDLNDAASLNEPFSWLGPDGYAYWIADAEDNATTGNWEALDGD